MCVCSITSTSLEVFVSWPYTTRIPAGFGKLMQSLLSDSCGGSGGRSSTEGTCVYQTSQILSAPFANMHTRSGTDILREHRHRFPGGVVHSFTGSPADLEAYLEMGLCIGACGGAKPPEDSGICCCEEGYSLAI